MTGTGAASGSRIGTSRRTPLQGRTSSHVPGSAGGEVTDDAADRLGWGVATDGAMDGLDGGEVTYDATDPLDGIAATCDAADASYGGADRNDAGGAGGDSTDGPRGAQGLPVRAESPHFRIVPPRFRYAKRGTTDGADQTADNRRYGRARWGPPLGEGEGARDRSYSPVSDHGSRGDSMPALTRPSDSVQTEDGSQGNPAQVTWRNELRRKVLMMAQRIARTALAATHSGEALRHSLPDEDLATLLAAATAHGLSNDDAADSAYSALATAVGALQGAGLSEIGITRTWRSFARATHASLATMADAGPTMLDLTALIAQTRAFTLREGGSSRGMDPDESASLEGYAYTGRIHFAEGFTQKWATAR